MKGEQKMNFQKHTDFLLKHFKDINTNNYQLKASWVILNFLGRYLDFKLIGIFLGQQKHAKLRTGSVTKSPNCLFL